MTLAPIAPAERIESIDILRGLALFGVLLENMQHFVSPTYAVQVASPEAGGLDRLALALVRLLCDNKVYLIFSLLFGYGIALQIARAGAARAGFAALHAWRMAVLLLIGLAHTVLLWEGDILFTYALLGFLLLPLRGASDRTLAILCALLVAAPSAALAGTRLAVELARPDAATLEPLLRTVAVQDYPMRQACFAFAMFVGGLLLGRRLGASPPEALLPRGRRALLPALALGLAANLAAVALFDARERAPLSGSGLAAEAAVAVGTPTLAYVYLWGALWWVRRPAGRARLRPFAAVGRATLTNYLLQSAIGVGLLRHASLGPWGPITPPVGIALSVVVFGAQLAASRWWLRRFRFGPVEWLWRSLTYGARQPWRAADSGGES